MVFKKIWLPETVGAIQSMKTPNTALITKMLQIILTTEAPKTTLHKEKLEMARNLGVLKTALHKKCRQTALNLGVSTPVLTLMSPETMSGQRAFTTPLIGKIKEMLAVTRERTRISTATTTPTTTATTLKLVMVTKATCSR